MISKILKKNTRCNKKRNRNHTLYDYNHLAIQQSKKDAKSGRHLGNWDTVKKDDWHFPGTKEQREFCGKWNGVGCLNEEEYERKGFGRKSFVKPYKSTCKRADCRDCVDDWLVRNADRAAKRIERYAKKHQLPAYHLALSPSKENQTKSEEELRNDVEAILNEINCKGGGLIFHPFRQKQKSTDWYWSPHFHFVGFGWMRLVKEVAEKYGWVVIYLKKRKYLFGTFCYLFKHCGIKKGRHTITWLGGLSYRQGDLSYGKLETKKPTDSDKCPGCGRKLVPIFYAGKDPVVPPDNKSGGSVDSEGWCEVKTLLASDNKSEYKFDYDSRKETNEILRSLAIS